MKVYIAGPMSGLPEFNHPAFEAAEEQLRDQGHEPLNPSRIPKHPDDMPEADRWLYYMRRALVLLAQADAVALLDGWQRSRGANIERSTAESMGLPIYLADDLSQGNANPGGTK